MKRVLFMVAAGLLFVGCNSSQHFFVKDTLATLPSGDQVVMMAEYYSSSCQRTTSITRTDTTWTRAGQPDRPLTVSSIPDHKPVNYSLLKTREIDRERFVLINEQGQVQASFDYDHARAYFGAQAQPAWASEVAARAAN